MECDVFPLNEDAAQAADRLLRALARIAEPLTTLRERLLARLDDEAEDLDEATRNRIEAIGRSLTRRALNPLSAWQAMLRDLADDIAESGSALTAFTSESALAVSTGATWAGAILGWDCWSFAGPGEVLLAGELWAQIGARGSKMRVAAASQSARVDF